MIEPGVFEKNSGWWPMPRIHMRHIGLIVDHVRDKNQRTLRSMLRKTEAAIARCVKNEIAGRYGIKKK